VCPVNYQAIKEFSADEITEAIKRNDPQELLYAVLSAALYCDDPRFAEDICLQLARHEHFNVRGNAILGFAHIARIHQILDERKVKPIIKAALRDESEYVRGHAGDAKNDIEFYLKWKFNK
jgi:hypothetical protein